MNPNLCFDILFFSKIIECKNNPALICNQCVDDLVFADGLRKRCLESDRHFRSTVPKKFFRKVMNETIGETPWRLNKTVVKTEPADHFSFVEVGGTLEDKYKSEHGECEDGSDDQALASLIKSEKQSEDEEFNVLDNILVRSSRRSSYPSKPSNSTFVQRIYQHTPQNLIKSQSFCDKCDYRTIHKKQLLRHVRTAHSRKRFDCETCGKRLLSEPGFNFHRLQHLEVDPADLVHCETCQKSFKHPLLLKAHVTRRHSSRT